MYRYKLLYKRITTNVNTEESFRAFIFILIFIGYFFGNGFFEIYALKIYHSWYNISKENGCPYGFERTAGVAMKRPVLINLEQLRQFILIMLNMAMRSFILYVLYLHLL